MQNAEIKDPTISMPRLTVMYKDSSLHFQKSGTCDSPRLGKKGLFAKHLKYLFTEAFCTPENAY